MGWKIFIPGDNVWDETSLCVWEAPNGIRLEKKYSLAQGFLSLFPESKSNQILLEDFFINTLNVSPKCTWEDLVEEIRWITSEGSEDNFETVHALYECLSHMSLNSDDKKQLRFVNHSLAMYIPVINRIPDQSLRKKHSSTIIPTVENDGTKGQVASGQAPSASETCLQSMLCMMTCGRSLLELCKYNA